MEARGQGVDRQSALVSLVAGDLRRHGVRETGRRGLPAARCDCYARTMTPMPPRESLVQMTEIVHPGDTLQELVANLTKYTLDVKRQFSPQARHPSQ